MVLAFAASGAAIPLLAQVGCGTIATAPISDDVITLESCPSGATCRPIADGQSTITVKACLPPNVHDPRSDLAVELRLSSGAWVFPAPADGASARVLDLPLVDRCVLPAFRTDLDATIVRVDATVHVIGGTSLPYARSISIPLSPAPLTNVSLGLLENYLGPLGVGRTLIAQAQSGVGTPSRGTTLSFFVVSSDPSSAGPYVYPNVRTLTGSTDASVALVPGAATVITVGVVATPPPPPPGGTASPAVTTTTVLRQPPAAPAPSTSATP